MAMGNNNENSMLNNLDILLKVSALIISVSFIFSVSYDYGYFKAYGLSFSDVPTTINDHIRNTLVSIPYTFAVSLCWWIYAKLNIIDNNKNTSESKLVSKIDKFGDAVDALTIKAISVIGVGSLIAYIFIGNKVPLFLIILGLMVIYGYLILPGIVKKYNLYNVSREIIVILIFGPFLLLMVFLKGSEVAKSDISSKLITHKIYLKDINDILSASSIRYFDKFVIINKLDNKKPTIVFLSEIRKVEQVAENNVGFKGLIDHFGYVFR